MRTPIVRAAALAALAVPAALSAALVVLAGPAGPAVAQPPGLSPDVEVTLASEHATASVGERLTIRARIVNSGDEPTDRLVAHVNVATLDESVYVDLEDWTLSPTHELAPLPPGGSASVAWELQAVNVGRFGVYAVVLPNGPASAGKGPLVVSSPELVEVAGRRTLSAGGALPVAIVEPVLLGLAAVAIRVRLRRSR